MNKITPFLWFNDNAEAAADFYLSIFPDGRKLNELRCTEAGPLPVGALLAIDIEIAGQQVTFLNGGPAQKLSDAFSFVIRCESQQEIDDYWAKLTDGGSETACGWLKDKFGVSWQVVPNDIYHLVSHPAAMRALKTMKKLDIAALEEAASQPA
ncbi:MAG: VOC family protein [Terracidiphilus sp.]|jgi:predicted 3-demethylubiquinone-9 3-methyltransferase (glyoxalase superfamily)